jgi:hypothetical protein
MSLSLVALAVEVQKGFISINFARRVAEIALGVFTVVVLWNHEGWVVNRNIDRAVQSGKFDLAYASSLSADAIPSLIGRRGELGPNVAAQIEAAVTCTRGVNSRRWFEWNRSAIELRQALESVHPAPCGRGETLRWPRRVD